MASQQSHVRRIVICSPQQNSARAHPGSRAPPSPPGSASSRLNCELVARLSPAASRATEPTSARRASSLAHECQIWRAVPQRGGERTSGVARQTWAPRSGEVQLAMNVSGEIEALTQEIRRLGEVQASGRTGVRGRVAAARYAPASRPGQRALATHTRPEPTPRGNMSADGDLRARRCRKACRRRRRARACGCARAPFPLPLACLSTPANSRARGWLSPTSRLSSSVIMNVLVMFLHPQRTIDALIARAPARGAQLDCDSRGRRQ